LNSHFDSFHRDSLPFKVKLDRGAQAGDLVHSQRWLQEQKIDMGRLGGGSTNEDSFVELWHKPLG
jgi:hypothetical protein